MTTFSNLQTSSQGQKRLTSALLLAPLLLLAFRQGPTPLKKVNTRERTFFFEFPWTNWWSSQDGGFMPFDMGVSKNRGTSKSSILVGFSIINHPFWGFPPFLETPIWHGVSDSATMDINTKPLDLMKIFFIWESVRLNDVFLGSRVQGGIDLGPTQVDSGR